MSSMEIDHKAQVNPLVKLARHQANTIWGGLEYSAFQEVSSNHATPFSRKSDEFSRLQQAVVSEQLAKSLPSNVIRPSAVPYQQMRSSYHAYQLSQAQHAVPSREVIDLTETSSRAEIPVISPSMNDQFQIGGRFKAAWTIEYEGDKALRVILHDGKQVAICTDLSKMVTIRRVNPNFMIFGAQKFDVDRMPSGVWGFYNDGLQKYVKWATTKQSNAWLLDENKQKLAWLKAIAAEFQRYEDARMQS